MLCFRGQLELLRYKLRVVEHTGVNYRLGLKADEEMLFFLIAVSPCWLPI